MTVDHDCLYFDAQRYVKHLNHSGTAEFVYTSKERRTAGEHLKILLSERPDLFLFENDNYTKTKHGNNRQNATNLTRRLFNV